MTKKEKILLGVLIGLCIFCIGYIFYGPVPGWRQKELAVTFPPAVPLQDEDTSTERVQSLLDFYANRVPVDYYKDTLAKEGFLAGNNVSRIIDSTGDWIDNGDEFQHKMALQLRGIALVLDAYWRDGVEMDPGVIYRTADPQMLMGRPLERDDDEHPATSED